MFYEDKEEVSRNEQKSFKPTHFVHGNLPNLQNANPLNQRRFESRSWYARNSVDSFKVGQAYI